MVDSVLELTQKLTERVAFRMPESSPTIRIFISSPGDVEQEREGARRVIEGLQRDYRGATLKPVLWEDLALPANASFQETIDILLEREPIDIAVFILWSRLGSPLGASITRPDGSPYRSGTEREFDLMLSAFEQSGRKRPVIFAYVRDDHEAFTQRVSEAPETELREAFEQRELAKNFIVEQFHDAEGRNLRAYQTYREPVAFVQRLRVHLRQAIDDLLGADAAPTWTEEPYRGLEVFEISHAQIFHGRDEQTCELQQSRRDQEQAGCAFVVIVGASGSGKSSLARAGVAASLMQNAGDDGITLGWRVATYIPALAAGGLCTALLRSLVEQLPELSDSQNTIEELAESLAENPMLTVKLSLSPAFARASEQAGGRIRWLLILDQLEELWTDRNITEEDRERFLTAIEALAQCGHLAVLATLRSDFYQHAQTSAGFLRLKGKSGHFDLCPPDSASLHRLITEPAKQAGLRFERNEQKGRSLDEVILADASKSPDALPLLEYTLSELYRQRDGERRLLTYAAYTELGGVEGAIGKRAEEVFQKLHGEAQNALDEVLPLLVSVDLTGEQSAVRRRASLAELTATDERKTLTDSLTKHRFLTTDREGDSPIASLAHEALLRRWERIVNWITTNREHLQLRTRIEQSQKRYEQKDREKSLLLPEGLPLDEGRKLLTEAPHLLAESTREYIDASIDHHEDQAKRRRRNRRVVLSTIAALVALMVIGGLYLRANHLVDGLLTAQTSDVKRYVEDLAPYSLLARPKLMREFVEQKDDPDARLHAALALNAHGGSKESFLVDRLLTAQPEQVPVIASLLKEQGAHSSGRLWRLMEDPYSDRNESLLNLAGALSIFDPDNGQKWENVAPQVVDELVKENPLRLATWIETFRPVKKHLVPPLCEVFRSDSEKRDQSEIDFATNVLKVYASENFDLLSELLLDAQPKQFATLFDEWRKHGDMAADLMTEALDAPPESDREMSDQLALRQSRAATALLRMGKVRPILDLMRRDLQNPEAMTQFVHRCRDSGTEPSELWRCLQEASLGRDGASADQRPRIDRSMYGILLALGEFSQEEIRDSDQQAWVEQLVDWYADHPSSAVHGATGWLLRQWGHEDDVRRIDETPKEYDPEREWYVMSVDLPKPKRGQLGQLFGGGSSNEPERIYFTMIVFQPGEFVMGSPADEPARQSHESMRTVRLTQVLAVSDREVTWAQFNPFDDSSHRNMWFRQDGKRRDPSDPASSVSWFEAVAYCRWLTTQSEAPESDQCYSGEPLESNADPDPGWVKLPDSTPWPFDPKQHGFRLLTEGEWEYVCRSGTRTTYPFGNDRTLLDRYGWFLDNSSEWSHEVGQLRPNPRGLFDVHGNVYEWCHDLYESRHEDEEDPDGPETGSDRVYRGGGWGSTAGFLRSAYRYGNRPSDRSYDLGFRLAAVLSRQPSGEVERGPESASKQSAGAEAEP